MLCEKGRLELDRPVLTWLKQAAAHPRVELIPLSPEIAVTAVKLNAEIPADPADRLIAAAARLHRADLISKDRLIRSFEGVRTVW